MQFNHGSFEYVSAEKEMSFRQFTSFEDGENPTKAIYPLMQPTVVNPLVWGDVAITVTASERAKSMQEGRMLNSAMDCVVPVPVPVPAPVPVPVPVPV